MGTANSRVLDCGEDSGVEEEEEARGPGVRSRKISWASRSYRECCKEGSSMKGVLELGGGGDDVRWKTDLKTTGEECVHREPPHVLA